MLPVAAPVNTAEAPGLIEALLLALRAKEAPVAEFTENT